MNDLDKLKQIPSSKINKDTYMLVHTIDAIKNKDYTFFKNQTYFIGFLKSLKREYGFDLSFMIDEYYDFHNIDPDNEQTQHNIITTQKIEKKTKQSVENTDDKNTSNNQDNKFSIFILLTIIVITMIVIFQIFSSEEKSQINTEDMSQKIENNTSTEINTTKPEEIEIVDKKEKYSFNSRKYTSLLKLEDGLLTIEPFRNNKLWLGVINLNNKSQRGEIIVGATSYKIKSHTLVSMGHGYFNFLNSKDGQKIVSYKTFSKLFFYYKNNKFMKITEEEFQKLNGGFGW